MYARVSLCLCEDVCLCLCVCGCVRVCVHLHPSSCDRLCFVSVIFNRSHGDEFELCRPRSLGGQWGSGSRQAASSTAEGPSLWLVQKFLHKTTNQ